MTDQLTDQTTNRPTNKPTYSQPKNQLTNQATDLLMWLRAELCSTGMVFAVTQGERE